MITTQRMNEWPTHWQTNILAYGLTDGQVDILTDTLTDRKWQTDWKQWRTRRATDRNTEKSSLTLSRIDNQKVVWKIDCLAERRTDRLTGTQSDWQTDILFDIVTDWQTERLTELLILNGQGTLIFKINDWLPAPSIHRVSCSETFNGCMLPQWHRWSISVVCHVTYTYTVIPYTAIMHTLPNPAVNTISCSYALPHGLL